ncbi:MAG: FimB/Mfa2 family fimbrial subunit [Bacteroidaceae bacterium]|nr:FimB/Mfa2 family fimbrial subunit [Bacteroidaceae bacterium]
MKKYSFVAGLLLLAAGCSNDVDMNVNSSDEYAQVSVRVNDFSLLVEDFPTTRAEQSVASYTGVKALTLAFYASNGSETYKTDQLRDDATTYTTFGEFSCNLPIGTYTMVVLGYGSETAITLTSPTEAAFDNDRVRETFAATQSVTVTSSTPVDLSVTLSRIMAKLNIVSTDGRSASVTKIRTTYAAGGQSFNPSTGLATVNTGFSVDNNVSVAVGNVINIGNYVFLASDEQDINITIQALNDNDDVLFTKVIADVPFKRNRVTKLSGAIFTTEPSELSINVENSWLNEATVNF